MAASTIFNLEVESGTTTTIDFFLKESDGVTPFDLTGWSARMHVRTAYNVPGAPLLSFTSDGGDISIDTVEGSMRLTIDAADTNSISIPSNGKTLVYDLEIYEAGGIVYRPFKGTMLLYPQVTIE